MRLQVKVNVPLTIRMCLECPFYRYPKSSIYGECCANRYITDRRNTDTILLEYDDAKVVPDKCPLLKLEDRGDN